MLDLSMLSRMFTDRLGSCWSRRAESGRIYRELADSSDRALAELGLSRGDVTSVSSGQYGCP